MNTSYTLGLEFNGHTEEEVQNQIKEVKKNRDVCSEAVILVLKKKNKKQNELIRSMTQGKILYVEGMPMEGA